MPCFCTRKRNLENECEHEEKRFITRCGERTDEQEYHPDVPMLEPEVRLNTALPLLEADAFERFAGAHLNVVLRGFESVGEALKKRLGMEYIAVDYPYGAAGSEAFLHAVDAALGTDHRETIERGCAQAAISAERVLQPLRLLYQAEAAVAGDFAHADAMRRFLRHELGLRISAYCDDLDPRCGWDSFLEAVRGTGTTLVFGSSFERRLEDELPVSLIRFCYPVMDAVALGYQPYAGFDGVDYLLSDILNAILTYPYHRNGPFAQ